MPTIFVPPPLRSLADNRRQVDVSGGTVLEAIQDLDRIHPGMLARLVDDSRQHPALRAGLQISVNSEMAAQGLRQPVAADAEIHILPAIGGG